MSQVVLYRAAVKGVRRCLELGNEPPAQIDKLCNELLKLVEGDDAEASLKRFKESYKRLIAKGEQNDVYFNAVLKALDKAKDEEDAELWVLQSVNSQLLARAPVPR